MNDINNFETFNRGGKRHLILQVYMIDSTLFNRLNELGYDYFVSHGIDDCKLFIELR